MKLGELLESIRQEHPNAVLREDDFGLYFDLTGDDYPDDPILDSSHDVYLREV